MDVFSEASTFLAQQLQPLDGTERKKWITNVANHVQGQCLNLPVVEKQHIELAIKEANNTGLDDTETVFRVISAFDVPSFVYCEEKKKFLPDPSKKSLLAVPDAKSKYIRERYWLLWQKTCRHETFSRRLAPGTDETVKKNRMNLRKVENILSSSKMNDVVLLGLLTQLTEGRYYLEDPTGSVPIDITTANFSSGLFCEGCFLLAYGKYRDGILKVDEVGFPFPELAADSRAFFGSVNSWGGPSKTLLKHSRNLAELEKANVEHNIFAKTIVNQSTLAPLTPIAFPTHWNHDAALSLYPLPDLIVIGDPCQGFHITEQGCTVMNVGSFPKSKFAFKVYYPSSKTVEDSQIPDEE
uniref:DNA polymerase II subunit 2 n=1 Tax=Anopheles culicifacies TaxID=139723 RepID=A0A182M5M8_9DIPT